MHSVDEIRHRSREQARGHRNIFKQILSTYFSQGKGGKKQKPQGNSIGKKSPKNG